MYIFNVFIISLLGTYIISSLISLCLLFCNGMYILYTSYRELVAGHFKLSGADNPGIVHKLSSVLARNSLTIANLKTSHEPAPHGGTELFTSKYVILLCLFATSDQYRAHSLATNLFSNNLISGR